MSAFFSKFCMIVVLKLAIFIFKASSNDFNEFFFLQIIWVKFIFDFQVIKTDNVLAFQTVTN